MSRAAALIGVVSAGLLLGALVSTHASVDEDAIAAYMVEVREAAERMPVDSGEWISSEVEVPPSATKLLRPNVLIARRYETAARGGHAATLMVVHCGDTRDMQGHYPPNCYPAHGWQTDGAPREAEMGDLQAVRYEFVRRSEQGDRSIVVYNLFVLPTGELTDSMQEVRRASADYQIRSYGAAQVQVVFDGSEPDEDHAWILAEMRGIASPVIDLLRAGAAPLREGAER